MSMTDDKKIEEAAKHYAEENSMSIEDQMGDIYDGIEELSDAYKAGAKWMQKEFLKNIWHTDDEMPESGKTILIKGLEWHNTVGGYNLFNTRTDIDLGDFDEKIQWDNFCECAGVDFKWCYLEDLLPKRGEQ